MHLLHELEVRRHARGRVEMEVDHFPASTKELVEACFTASSLSTGRASGYASTESSATIWSRSSCPGGATIGSPAIARTRSNASAIAAPRTTGPCADAVATGSSRATPLTCAPYFTGSSHWCHGETRLLSRRNVSSYIPAGTSPCSCTAHVVMAANESTDHSARVLSSNSARVAGPSKIGGTTRCSLPSPPASEARGAR